MNERSIGLFGGSRVVGFLLVGVLFLLGAAVVPAGPSDSSPQGDEGAVASASGAGKADREIVLYYFHGVRRCRTCLSIEAYATEAIETDFADQLADGTLVWKVVNYEQKANRHFVEDFGLVSSSLVVVEADGDAVERYKVLQEAWTLVRKKPQFIDYVQNSVQEFLD